MKIEWAPVQIPPRRRIQTLCVLIHVIIAFTVPFTSTLLVLLAIILGNNLLRLLALSYVTYIYYDHKHNFSAIHGNGWKLLRNNYIWRNFRAYFPIELVKTVDLKPDKNYIIASFPHGVVGLGVYTNMATDIGKFLALFPGIRPKVATLNIHFLTPIWREVMRAWGTVPVSREALTHFLSATNDPKHIDNSDGCTSNAVAIVVGGANEALDARPGNYVITLKERKGFVRLAINTGSAIVPSFSFGEVDVFDQVDNPPDSFLRQLQLFIKKVTGVSPIILRGRGIFQYSCGLLPHRKTIVQVVGKPIEVLQNDNPTEEYIKEIHQKFITAISDLFEEYKHKYIENADKTKLIIQ